MRYIIIKISLLLISLSLNAQIRKDNVKNVLITVSGTYKMSNSNKYTSIYIPSNTFDEYDYVAVKANKEHGAYVHILREEPKKQNEQVQYSDYYNNYIIVQKGMKLDIVLPPDAKCIYILNKAVDNYRPDEIDFYTKESLSDSKVSAPQIFTRRVASGESQKFMHWNIGHFSKGKKPYSIIREDSYKVRLDGFVNFITTYCPDCHYLLNEYDDTFANHEGISVKTPTVLFDKRTGYKIFPRTTSSGYNNLAIFWKEGLISYKYDVFQSLKGVKNSNGTLEYGTGYCISQYDIDGIKLYVMSLHAPNGIKREEHNALYREMLSICSEYDNCILVGDFNRITNQSFAVLTKAGFNILNDKSITAPATRHIVDWVLYRCKDVFLSDFRVYPEAVDGNGELLSDHLPLSFKVTHK